MRKIANWLEEYSAGESLDILCDLALSHAAQGGRLGHRISALIRRGDFRGICEFEFDYLEFASKGYTPEQVYHCRQAVAFFSKLENLEIGIDKEEAAIGKFLEAEQACKETNEVFRAHAEGRLTFPPRVERILVAAQRKIAWALGPVPRFDELGYRFGKGATTLTKKRMASLREKFRAGVSCSEELFPAAVRLLGELPQLSEAWADVIVHEDDESRFLVPVVINDGVLDFAPKNAKTFRATVKEPPLNGLFQNAVGDLLIARFGRFGLNLRDQTRNQRLALRGSRDGDVATIDLVSASDMKAIELVFHLLPLDWATFLARGRSGHVTYKGHRLTLEKFSSMGNGFTFPLESLIFWALTTAVCGTDDPDVVSVFGDDIICPSDRFEEVIEILRICGFEANRKKSFAWGLFRESCGKDYYRGIDIRPYFPSDWVSGRSLFTLHNYYVRRGDLERATSVRRLIHPSLKIFGPDGFGDGHLLGDWNRSRKTNQFRKGYSGYTFDTFTLSGRKDIRPEMFSDFVLPSYSIYRREAPDDVVASVDPVNRATIGETIAVSKFLRRFNEAGGTICSGLPIPDVKLDDGSVVKGVSLPIDVSPEYRRISIYTLKS